MKPICLVVAAVLMLAPALAASQDVATPVHKHKVWTLSNFRTGLACTGVDEGVLAFSGAASFEVGGKGGIEVTITRGAGGVPTATAHAINTKGTGANNGRVATPACPSPSASSGEATCRFSGDPESPMVTVSVPLAALLDPEASRYVGTVTIVKRMDPDGSSMPLGKKGYDHYRARSDMAAAGATVNPTLAYLATCDASGMSAKGGKPSLASYDLAVAKK